MADFLPPVIATLLADTKEFSAKIDSAQAKMDAMGKKSLTTGQKFEKMGGMMAKAVIGGGLAVAAISVKMAYDYNAALDEMARTTHLTAAQMDFLKGAILNVSTDSATSRVMSKAIASVSSARSRRTVFFCDVSVRQ